MDEQALRQGSINTYDGSSILGAHQTSSFQQPRPQAASDIVVAYKELKKFLALSKDDAAAKNTLASLQYNPGSKSYMKNTVSMMQHSKIAMNKELLRYSLEKRQKHGLAAGVTGTRRDSSQPRAIQDGPNNFMLRRTASQ